MAGGHSSLIITGIAAGLISYITLVKQNGKNITGIGTGMRWSLEIQRKKYEPEGFLRLISIVQEGLLNSRK